MAEAMTYRVEVVHEDDVWQVDIPAAQGAFTESDDLAGLDTYCREVVVLGEELPESAMPGLEFEWVLRVTSDDLVDALAQDRGVPRTEILARGWSLADVAAVLKVPVERVHHAPPPQRARIAH
jgi:hypothetical protein